MSGVDHFLNRMDFTNPVLKVVEDTFYCPMFNGEVYKNRDGEVDLFVPNADATSSAALKLPPWAQVAKIIAMAILLRLSFVQNFMADQLASFASEKAGVEILLKEHYYAITDSKSNSLETTSQKLYQELVQPAIEGREDIIKNIIF